jgi:hypothetical protein
MKLIPCLSICAIALFSWNSAVAPVAPPKDKELQLLVKWMTGDFSSKAQSERDSDYFDIRLHIRPIWKAEKGSHWLYVEQATAAAEDKPYRQRIYKVEKDGAKGYKSIVYTLPTPEKWIGGYKNVAVFNTLKPADLTLREGCTVYLERQADGTFSGATKAGACESNLRGATNASSKVTVSKRVLESWDQGFNDKGEQVWGAVKGGYIFVKTSK